MSGTDEITGFTVGADGMLTPIPGSTQSLSAANTGPAQVSFNADGDVLVVTEKATSLIDTFTVGSDGVAVPANTFASSGMTPFGFAIRVEADLRRAGVRGTQQLRRTRDRGECAIRTDGKAGNLVSSTRCASRVQRIQQVA